MYTSINVDAFKQRLQLPADYKIDGLLASGTWDLYAKNRHVPHLESAFKSLGIDSELIKIETEELGHAYEFTVEGKRYWFVPVMGTAVMSQYAHLASLLGSKKNILVGMVGGLKNGIKPGDFIIPSASKGNENALMYDRTKADLLFYPDQVLTDSLKHRMSHKTIYEGITNTCEVMFAETAEDVKSWSELGYLGVEMEAAMMFALSSYFNVPSTALLYVADNLVEEVTMFDEGYGDSKVIREDARKLQYEVALAELLA